jgi:Uma2 family endonuclease
MGTLAKARRSVVPSAPSRLTARQFERLAPHLGPCELERGEVIPLSPGSLGHSGISANVAILLGMWARRTAHGRVYTNEAGVVTESDPDTVRGVDVAYFSFKRLPRGRQPSGFARVPPNLAVEIIGKGQGWKKMVEKAGEYLRMGVDRVWIIDPKKRSVCVLRPDSEPVILTGGQTVADPRILPGFRCKIREFFA